MSTTQTEHIMKFDPAHLNSIGHRRIEEGVLCFARPVRSGVEAICIDFGVAARGADLDEARANLDDCIDGLVEAACLTGNLEYLLNSPNNRAAEKQMRRTHLAFSIVASILWPLALVMTTVRAIHRHMESTSKSEFREPIRHLAAC